MKGKRMTATTPAPDDPVSIAQGMTPDQRTMKIQEVRKQILEKTPVTDEEIRLSLACLQLNRGRALAESTRSKTAKKENKTSLDDVLDKLDL